MSVFDGDFSLRRYQAFKLISSDVGGTNFENKIKLSPFSI